MSHPETRFPHVVIRASAGTGKTFQLSNRFIALVAAGEPPERILAATFARKAAGEILDRVLSRLAEAALDPDKLDELKQFIDDVSLSRKRCLQLLAALIRHLHRLRIGTLDSFFAQLAGSFSLELGLPPGWRIMDELDDRNMRDEAIQDVLQGESTSDLVTMMHLLSKGEITRSVTAEIREIVDRLYELFCVTDTGAWQSLPRLKQLSDDELTAAFDKLATLEFSDKRFIKAHLGHMESLRNRNWQEFVSKGISAGIVAGTNRYYRKPIEPQVIETYRPLIHQARAVLLGQIANQTEATRQLLDKFDAAYGRLKLRQRGLRFNDVTRSLVRGFSAGLIDDVAHRLDAQITHLLLDEFQDTSLLQWQVVRPFAERVTKQNTGRTFFCVGDVKQAIYHWRGGVSEIFDAVEQQFEQLTSKSLTKSFRSSQPVIDTVNTVFGGLDQNRALCDYPTVVELWRYRFQPQTTVHTDLPGYCCLKTAPRAAEGENQPDRTLEFAAEQIKTIAADQPGCSIGVLVRRNATVARLIYELRARQNLFASEEGGNPLTDSAAVQLILSLLKIADHPGDTAARFHVAGSPLGEIVGLERHDDSRAARRLSLEIRQRLLSNGYGATVYGWVKLLARHCNPRDLSRLMQLVETAYSYENQATVRADDFVHRVQSYRVENPTAADVRVMTLHQAKGLQFDVVVLPELDVDLKGQPSSVVVGRDRPVDPVRRVCRYVSDDLRPLLPAEFRKMFDDWADQSLNESLCMLYVTMTRPVHALHMIIAPSAKDEKTLPKKFSGLLRSALTDGSATAPETVLYEHGDPASLAVLKPRAAFSADDAAQTETLEIRLRKSPARRVRGHDRQSPSSLEGGSIVDLSQRLRLGQSAAMARGSLLHAWFEQVEWLDDTLPGDDILRRVAGQFVGANLDIETELTRFREMLDEPSLHTALSRAGYDDPAALEFPADVCRDIRSASLQLQVWRERSFAVREQDAVMQGTIDRLVLLSDGEELIAADVIDFKTDRVDETVGGIGAKVAEYRPQLEAYRRAVSRLSGLGSERISARLLFVGAGIVQSVRPSES